jgi:glycosyltransferase involved in cell wall biosynthesis
VRIAYIFEEFPCPSETSALREIECLRRRGFEIVVLCARRGDDGVGRQVWILMPPKLLSRRWLGALRHLLIRRWKRVLRFAAFWLWIAICSPRRAARILVDLYALGEFSKAIEAEGIRHVHGYWLGWPAHMAAALSVLTGASMSMSGHARDIFTETDSLGVLARRAKFIAICTEQGLHHLDAALGSNRSSKLRLVRHGLLPEEKTVFETARPLASPHIVAVGRLVEKKGFDVLLHAFRQIKAQHDGARLRIIGDGPQKGTLKALMHQLGLGESVGFTGWLSQNEVLANIRNARVLAVPSIIAADGDRDGVPNVILEAFACGTPVVASRLSGISEAIEHESSGLLATSGDPSDLAEAIRRVLDDCQLAERVAWGGRRVLEERFDAMVNSGELAKLFKEAMGQPC